MERAKNRIQLKGRNIIDIIKLLKEREKVIYEIGFKEGVTQGKYESYDLIKKQIKEIKELKLELINQRRELKFKIRNSKISKGEKNGI